MKEFERFELEKNGYVVTEASVCDIYDFFDNNPDECSIHQQTFDADYKYGYTYILIHGTEERDYVCGSYVSTDRFYQKDERIFKELFLYEFSIYDQEDLEEERVQASTLYEYLLMYAEKKGCNRIAFHANCGNEGFNFFIADKGFVLQGDCYVLDLGEVEMCDRDKIIIPTEKDALAFSTLFLLRESHFVITEDKCELRRENHKISIDRHSALVTFSPEITTERGDDFFLDTDRELNIIDALRQVLQRVPFNNAVIYDERPETDTFPDVIIDSSKGIFLTKGKRKTFAEYNDWLRRIKEEGKVTQYYLHTLHFDEEIGGCYTDIGFISDKRSR